MKYRNERVSQPKAIPVLVRSSMEQREGFATFLPGFESLLPVRVVDEDALTMFVEDGRRFQQLYGNIADRESSKLLGLLQLTKAQVPEEKGAVREAYQRLASASSPFVRQLQSTVIWANSQKYLAREMSKGGSRVRLVLWYTPQGQFLPGLFCPNALSALYALAVARITTGHGFGACLVCGKLLLRWRTTRKTCSNKCKQKLYRQVHQAARPAGGSGHIGRTRRKLR